VRTPVSIGIVGLGAWGPELARTFSELPQAELRWLCDPSPQAQLRVKARHTAARSTSDVADLLADESLDAIVLATPAATHAELTRRALEAEKHVFVGQPLALAGDDADDLVRLAKRKNRRLLVGNVVPHHPGLRKLKELIELGRLGDLYYLYGNRQGLGEVHADESVLWKLGGRLVSTFLYLVGDEPVEVSARGEAYVQRGIADVVFGYLTFATGITAHLHLSWLDPQQLRKLAVVGSKRMAIFDELHPEQKLTIHGKSVTLLREGETAQVRHGDIVAPRILDDEPIRLECEHFVASIRSPVDPAAARQGAAVVTVLEALQGSLDSGGVPTAVRGRIETDARVVPIRAPASS
jgi:predicted dehydrogenase